MTVAPADLALAVFTICNTARVFAYLPQIVRISRDTQGATAISYTTWALFGMSHLSTVAYALAVMNDWRMAAIFAANSLCCLMILSVTAWKRAQFKAAQKSHGCTKPSVGYTAIGTPAASSEVAASLVSGSLPHSYSLGVGQPVASAVERQGLALGR